MEEIKNSTRGFLTTAFVLSIIQEVFLTLVIIIFGIAGIAQPTSLPSAYSPTIIWSFFALLVAEFVVLLFFMIYVQKVKRYDQDSRKNMKIALILSIVAVFGNVGLFTVLNIVFSIIVYNKFQSLDD